jgi:hypothetical protein
MSVTPTRNSTWGGMELYDANSNCIKTSPYLGSVSANTTKSHTMTVERWMPISTGSPIQLYSYHALNAKPDEPAVCFGDVASNNFLNRR